MEQFLERMIQDAMAQNYGWLVSVSEPEALQELQALQPRLSPQYNIVFRDDLGGGYNYKLRFDTGVTLYLGLSGYWPECPDYNVTDQEITERIRLHFIQEEIE
jgi:hypothetical protein